MKSAVVRRPLAALFVFAILVGALLRYAMMGHGLWRDEASTFFDAFGGSWRDVTHRVAFSELNPPGFFLFMHAWFALLPVNDLTVKLPAALASLVIVGLSALIGARLGGPPLAVTAAWCAALAPMDLYYAQEARPYMFTACFALTAMIGFLDILDRRAGMVKYICFAGGIYGTLATQYTGGLFAVAMFAAWAIVAYVRGELRTVVVPWLVSALAVALGGLMLVPALLLQTHAGLSWNEHVGLRRYPEVGIRDALVMLPLDWFPVHEVMKAILAALIAGEAFWVWRRDKRLRIPGGMRTVMIFGIAVVMAILEIPISNHGRYMVPFSPLFWIALCALLLRGFDGTPQRYRLGAAIVGVFFFIMWGCDLSRIYHDRGTMKSGASLLTQIPLTVAGTGDIFADRKTRVLAVPDYIAPSAGYYLRDEPLTLNGFARWDGPQYFSPLEYAKLWNAPDAITQAQRKITEDVRSGAKYLVLLSMPTADSGSIPYSRGNELVRRLRTTYSCQQHFILIGTVETITVDLLQISGPLLPSRC